MVTESLSPPTSIMINSIIITTHRNGHDKHVVKMWYGDSPSHDLGVGNNRVLGGLTHKSYHIRQEYIYYLNYRNSHSLGQIIFTTQSIQFCRPKRKERSKIHSQEMSYFFHIKNKIPAGHKLHTHRHTHTHTHTHAEVFHLAAKRLFGGFVQC